MDTVIDFLQKPFAWGLALGLLFFCLSFSAHFKTKRELRRYKKLLSDKLELEARQYEVIRKEKDALTKENEHLRVRIQQLMEKPDQKIARDMETLARAEKRMVMQAPGFAPAWEAAKAQASEELAAEDTGKSLPKRLFNRLFGNSASRDLDARILTENASTPNGTSGSNGTAEATAASDAPADPVKAPSA